MKKILLTIAAFALAASTYAQGFGDGTLSFFNRTLSDPGMPTSRPVTLSPELGGGNATPAYSIALFARQANGSYVMMVNGSGAGVDLAGDGVGSFRTDNSGTMLGPITLVFDSTSTVGRRDAGSAVTFQVRAWLTSQGSWETASVRSETHTDYTINLGGTTPSGGTATPNFSGLGFVGPMIVPEPSTYALGIAGLGALAFLRRRK